VNTICLLVKKILLIQTASIGDVILATPVLEKLYDLFPSANIDILLKKGNETLFNNHPFLNNIIVWDKHQHKYGNLFKLLRQIRKRKYDLVINIQRFTSSGLLTAFSKARQTVGFSKNPVSFLFSKRVRHHIKSTNGLHETDRNLSLVSFLSSDANYRIKLYPSGRNYAKVSQYKTVPYITIAPASLWFTKQYPLEKWTEFLETIPDHIYVYLIGGHADQMLCEAIISSTGHSLCLNLAGKLGFLDTAALMRDAVMNYTNDSAPLHLASSVNAPVTAIFCSTVPAFGFGPKSDNAAVVETGLSLPCRPCGLHGYSSCPEKHFKCALTINVNKLFIRLNQP